MEGKKVLLTLNPEMYAELEGHAKANFMTMQELITNTLRKCVLYAAESSKKGKAGKPPKIFAIFLEIIEFLPSILANLDSRLS